MMDAQVALVPRGTAAESYRLFEAWRYGSIVICEPLPPRPFLQGAPVITVDSWQELEGALLSLLADPGRQHELHEASLRWWRMSAQSPRSGAGSPLSWTHCAPRPHAELGGRCSGLIGHRDGGDRLIDTGGSSGDRGHVVAAGWGPGPDG